LKRYLSKRGLGSGLVIAGLLFVVRPQVGNLQKLVAESLSWQLGRPVQMDSVHIRFLPQPGLELENLAIYDNGGLGAEPLLRAPEVTAWLRVSSLLRHRIEISSLSLNYASLNLARKLDGRWNIAELIERASRSSTAPTASNRKEARREFPYIEAEHARINFKNGFEKTHFALTNAEFALWQQSEDQWGMRLQARPIRTDANLTDTGMISLSGSWRRSVGLANTPVQFSLEWKQAQIGQLSELFSGADQGWRGGVMLDASLTGTLGNSVITADITADQLRQRDILANGNLRAVVHCAAEYKPAERSLVNVDCSAPAGDGTVELKGATGGIPFSSYDLTLSAKDLPAESLLELARHANLSVPQDLQAAGSINAEVSLDRTEPAARPRISGEGEALGVRISSNSGGAELNLGAVPLRLAESRRKANPSGAIASWLNASELEVGPATIWLGRPTPVAAELVISAGGYQGSVQGEATLKRLLQAVRTLRIPLPAITADGIATINLALSHQWGTTVSPLTGKTQLRAIRAQVRGLNSALQIHRADLMIAADAVRVINLEAAAGRTVWRGSVSVPRPCSAPDSCRFQFHLRSPELSAADLNQLFNPAMIKRPWYRLLTLETPSSFFQRASATGSIEIDKLWLGPTACNRFSAELELQKGRVSLTKVRGNLLGGRSTGTLKADFSERPPVYSGTGDFEGIALSEVAKLMHDGWVQGTASANYQFKAAGWKLQELLHTAELNSTFKIENGVFPHVVLAEGAKPLRASLFSGNIALAAGNFSLVDSKLQSDGGVYTVSGSASLMGTLNLRMTGESSMGYTLSGTLAGTRVEPITMPPTQAALKP
jgi:AsmA family/AsmA-like C-terminal region